MMMLCSTKAYVSVVNRLFGTLFLNDKWMLLDLVTSFSRPCFDFAGNSWFCRGLIYVILIQFWMLKVQVCVSWFWIKCVPLVHPLLIQSCFWNNKTWSFKIRVLGILCLKLMLKPLCLFQFMYSSSTKSFDLCISSHKLGAAHSWNTPVWTFCIYHFQLLINNYYLDIQGRLQWSFTKLPTW